MIIVFTVTPDGHTLEAYRNEEALLEALNEALDDESEIAYLKVPPADLNKWLDESHHVRQRLVLKCQPLTPKPEKFITRMVL